MLSDIDMPDCPELGRTGHIPEGRYLHRVLAGEAGPARDEYRPGGGRSGFPDHGDITDISRYRKKTGLPGCFQSHLFLLPLIWSLKKNQYRTESVTIRKGPPSFFPGKGGLFPV
jgi:hypothetical protein